MLLHEALSISSFENKMNRLLQNWWIGIILAVLGFLFSILLVDKIGFSRSLKIKPLYTADFEVPVGPYFYLDAWNFELSKPVLYHGLGDSIEHARAADILFIGNSRTQLGIREEFIVPLAQQHGLKVFSLGSGHAERVGFAMEVIKKHDLRPKVVVILGGSHVYHHSYSDVAKAAIELTRWDAQKLWLETALSWNFRYRLHRIVPKLGLLGHGISSGYIMYRSEVTGWWKPARALGGRFKTSYSEKPAKYRRALKVATRVQRQLQRRGSLLVTGVVPYRNTDYRHLELLKEKLDIPFVHPGLQLETADGSHLNYHSARQYTHAFWEIFIRLPEVRQRLSLE